MMTPTKTLLAATALCATTGGALANDFNAAEQCVIEKTQEEVRSYHRTVEAHIVNLNVLEDTCEAETGMQIVDPRILEPNSEGFYAGGTHFTFEYTPKP